tara:strand:+ start:108 stop:311 length:204 start_codon:yes stop_codon:yes gene_type:complete
MSEKEQRMIAIKSYSVTLADGTTGAFSTCFLNVDDLIGKTINVRTKDENGTPIERRGVLSEILQEWN